MGKLAQLTYRIRTIARNGCEYDKSVADHWVGEVLSWGFSDRLRIFGCGVVWCGSGLGFSWGCGRASA
jgi:hypothetical protein